MLRDTLRLRPQLHLPLRRVALCLDCDECFELGTPMCPGCGSETWTPLARFLGAAMSSLGSSGYGSPLQPEAA